MGFQIEELTELVEGSSLFVANGYSHVKVTRGGKVVALKVPIKSSGVADLIDEFNRKAPQPPARTAFIGPDDEIGKAMGLKKKEGVYLSDFTDPKYLKAKEEHDRNLGMMILLKGIDLPIKDKDGKLIDDPDRKIEVLRKMGMSGEQFSQIVSDITLLTKWEDEKENDFLSE